MSEGLPPVEAEPERIGLDDDELPRAKQAYPYLADSRLLARIDRLQKSASTMVRDPSLPLGLGVLPFHLEPADWRAGYLKVREVELPPELYHDIHQNTPQALLRDLYRPEYEAFVWYDRETLVTLDLGGVKALADAMAAQRRDPLPVVQPLTPELMERSQRWQKIVRDRWLPIFDDSEPRKRVTVLHDPSLIW